MKFISSESVILVNYKILNPKKYIRKNYFLVAKPYNILAQNFTSLAKIFCSTKERGDWFGTLPF